MATPKVKASPKTATKTTPKSAKPVSAKADAAAAKAVFMKNKTAKLNISAYELKHIGSEPKWDEEVAKGFDEETYTRHMRASLAFYNYFYSVKDLKKHVDRWAQENMELSKEDLALYIMSGVENTPMTVCSLVRANMAGMPMRDHVGQYLAARITTAIEAARNAPEVVAKIAKKETYTPTIQDRIAEKTADIAGNLESIVDDAYLNKPTASVYDYIKQENLPQSQVNKVRAIFQQQIDELALVSSGTDEQVKEAYAFLSAKDIKRINAFYTKMMADFDSYAAVKKAAKKVRVKKAPSKEKLVTKLKFLKEHAGLKLVSIPPTDILGANALWVYHTKYRKLYRYVAETQGSLSVKGTSIVGYSESQSVGKTLRNPEAQLQDLMKTGKVGLRTFLKNIKAVEISANGRMSEEILLLKVE